MKRLLKSILYILGAVSTILGIIDFFIKYKSNSKEVIRLICQLDLYTMGQILLIIGVLIILLVLFSFMLLKIFKIRMPQKSVADLIGPALFPEETWRDADAKHSKKTIRYYVFLFGIIVIAFGLSLVIVMQIYNYLL